MVFCFQIVLTYSDLEKLLEIEAEGQEFSKFLRSLHWTIYLIEQWRVSTIFEHNAFLTYSLRFLQLEFKLEKIIGI
jgi:hypothetical protein